MRRCEFITLLGGAAAWPLAARAQQPTGIRRLGVLLNLSENDAESQRLVTAFRQGLAQQGWADGRNLRIDYRWAAGDVGRIRVFAKELVELSPDIIVGYATPSVVALQQETLGVSHWCCTRPRNGIIIGRNNPRARRSRKKEAGSPCGPTRQKVQ